MTQGLYSDIYDDMIEKSIRRFQTFIEAEDDSKIIKKYLDNQKLKKESDELFSKSVNLEIIEKLIVETKSTDGVNREYVGKTNNFTRKINKNINIKVTINNNIVVMEFDKSEIDNFSGTDNEYISNGVPYVLLESVEKEGMYKEYYVRKDIVILEVMAIREFVNQAINENSILNIDTDFMYVKDVHFDEVNGDFNFYCIVFNLLLDENNQPYHTVVHYKDENIKLSDKFLEQFQQISKLCVAKGCEYLVTGEIK